MVPGKIYTLTKPEQVALKEFIQDHLKKGYIKPSISLYTTPFFFIKKKTENYNPYKTTESLINGSYATNIPYHSFQN